MKPIPLFLIFLILLTPDSNAQTALWARDFGTPSQEQGQKITTDGRNIYTCGWYMHSMTMCGAPLPAVIQPTGLQLTGNMFISKLDASGTCLWTSVCISHVLPDPYGPYFTGLEYDGMGHLYATGFFSDTMIFGNDTLFSPTCTDYCNTPFLMKMDTNGNFTWAVCFKGSTNAEINAPVVGGLNIYVSGTYKDSLFFDGIHIGTPASYASRSFIAKLDTSGHSLWAHNIGTSPYNTANFSLNFDGKYLYTLGRFIDSLVLPAQVLHDPGPLSGLIYMIKYDTSGNVVWGKGGYSKIHGSLHDGSMIYDNASHLYVVGMFNDSVTIYGTKFTTSSTNIYKDYVARFDTAGNFEWAIAAGNKWLSGIYPSCMTADDSGLYLVAAFMGTVVIGDSTYTCPSGDYDWTITRYHRDSTAIRSKHIGGPGTMIPGAIVKNQSDLYFTGFSFGSYSIDTVAVNNAGAGDVLIVKFRDSIYTVAPPVTLSSLPRTGTRVYPNPTDGKVYLDVLPGSKMISVCTVTGRLVLQKNIMQSTETIDISSMATGLYLLKVISDQGCETIRIYKD